MPKDIPKKGEKRGIAEHKTEEIASISENKNGSVLVKILAKPGAKQNKITDITDEGIHVQIAAPPVEGAANVELVKYLSAVLNVRKSDLNLERGSKSRDKTLSVSSSLLKPREILDLLNKEKNLS